VRILWLSNAPWVPSGYGQQTALFAPRLAAAGHEVSVLCNYGLQGREMSLGPITCCPGDAQWGNANLAPYAARHQADLVIALCDAFVLRPDLWPESLDMPVWVWAPVDHQPCPPLVAQVLAHPRLTPVAMSRFGQEQLREQGLDPLYVPHGVDSRVFRPRPEIRAEVRAELGIPPDVFLAGMVAANTGGPVSRKGFPQAFQAFTRFAETSPDAWLYVHTQPRPAGGGLQLDMLAEACGCPQARLRFPHAESWELGYSAESVAHIYQAFDVLLQPSMGEGFGIPILEAQACGVPVIASDHSAMPELVEAGWLVDGDPWWDETQKSFFLNPSVGGIVDALGEAYQARDDQPLRARAAGFARGYDADLVTGADWLPHLQTLQSHTEAAGRLTVVGGRR
jgi:glycosyltransferase involved in cell wall biosynthesis